jgi:UDP-glucose 4-epimerase
MSILVTGGAGYIGSHTAALLVERGYDVVVFDDLSTGHREAVPAEARLVVGDLAHAERVSDLFRTHRVDAVLHFAANSQVGHSMRAPFAYLRDNVVNFLNLAQAAVAHGCPPIILSSTANLYGAPEAMPIAEDCPVLPPSPYGESKNFAERVLAWMDAIYGLRSARLRYFNAAGADPKGRRGEDHDPETHLIPCLLQVALGQRPRVEIFGSDYDTEDGTCVRDYVHVCDLAQAHVLALEALLDGAPSMCFNLGNGSGYSVLQVLEAARRITGHPIPAVLAARRAGDPARLVAASDQIRTQLGWCPAHDDLDEIVATAWAWHRAHPHGYRTGREGALQPALVSG